MRYFHQLAVYEYGYQPIREADSVSEIKETRRFMPVIPCDMFPTPWLRGLGSLPRRKAPVSREEGPSPVGASGARGAGRPAEGRGARSTAPTARSGPGGRTTGTHAPRHREARRWNALFSSRRDFAPEWRTVWGGVSHRLLLPTPDPLPGAF